MHLPNPVSLFLLVGLASAFSAPRGPPGLLRSRDRHSLAGASQGPSILPRFAGPCSHVAPDADADVHVCNLVRRALVARAAKKDKPNLKLPKSAVSSRFQNQPPAKQADPAAKASYAAGLKAHHDKGIQKLKNDGVKLPDPAKHNKADINKDEFGRAPFFEHLGYRTGWTPPPPWASLERQGNRRHLDPFDQRPPTPPSRPHSEEGKAYLTSGYYKEQYDVPTRDQVNLPRG